jgi:hypothetical protein
MLRGGWRSFYLRVCRIPIRMADAFFPTSWRVLQLDGSAQIASGVGGPRLGLSAVQGWRWETCAHSCSTPRSTPPAASHSTIHCESVTAEDHLAYRAWRRLDVNGPRVAASTWDREVAAVNRLYAWQAKAGAIDSNPLPQRAIRYGIHGRPLGGGDTARPQSLTVMMPAVSGSNG